MGEVTRRLKQEGIPTRTGRPVWDLRDDPCGPQEPGVQGDGGVRQDAGGAVQAATAPAATRQAGVPQEADDPGRHAGGGPDLHRCPRAGQRGPVRGGPRATRGEPEATPRPGPRRKLPAPGVDRLQGLWLCLLRRDQGPTHGGGAGRLRLLPLPGLRGVSFRRAEAVPEQADSHGAAGCGRVERRLLAALRAGPRSRGIPATPGGAERGRSP